MEALSWLLFISGAIFIAIGTAGLIRMPNFITKLHAASLIDVFGSVLILLSLMIQAENWQLVLRLLLLVGIIILVSPVITNMMYRIHKKEFPDE